MFVESIAFQPGDYLSGVAVLDLQKLLLLRSCQPLKLASLLEILGQMLLSSNLKWTFFKKVGGMESSRMKSVPIKLERSYKKFSIIHFQLYFTSCFAVMKEFPQLQNGVPKMKLKEHQVRSTENFRLI